MVTGIQMTTLWSTYVALYNSDFLTPLYWSALLYVVALFCLPPANHVVSDVLLRLFFRNVKEYIDST